MRLLPDLGKEQEGVQELIGMRSANKEDRTIFGDVESTSRSVTWSALVQINPARTCLISRKKMLMTSRQKSRNRSSRLD